MLKAHGKINLQQSKEKYNWEKTFCNISQTQRYICTIEIASKCRQANTIDPMQGGAIKKYEL